MRPFVPTPSRRRPPLAAVAGLVLGAVLAACAVTVPAMEMTDPPADEAVPRLDWAACGDGFECATATVPLDHDDPRGGQIELALVRLPAGDPERRIGSLFTNPGGPGLPGTDTLRALAPTFPAEVRARFDVIGLDPRGVGRSTPVACFTDPASQGLALSRIVGWPADGDAAERAAFDRGAEDLARACAERSGALLDHVSTADVARDLDLLRRAVGDERLSFHGLSYGSYLGATYAALFPDRVRALVLDGVLEPTAFTGIDAPEGTLPWLRVGNDVATDEVLREFFALCSTAGAACPLGVGGDPGTRYGELLAALDAAPLVVADPTYGDQLIRGDAVSIATQAALPAPTSWAPWSAVLAELHRLLVVEGDRDAALALYLSTAQQAPTPEGRAMSNQLEANLATICTDTETPDDLDQVAAAALQARQRAPYAADRWSWITAACTFWAGEAEDRYTGPFTPATAAPLLVVGTVHDPNTAYRSARSYAAELPSAGFLTFDGWGHTASFQGYSTCIDDAVAAYLVDGALPAPGTTCAPDPGAVPFAADE